MAQRDGTGIFPGRSCNAATRHWPNAFPLLLPEEEGRLNDLPLLESFIEWVFAY
jgi:hypothetical protein